MAEFKNQVIPVKTDMGPGNAFDAMGKPIPSYRRQAGYDHCRSMGLGIENAWSTVNGMCDGLERDQPYDAIGSAMKYIDLTGCYRLMAVLLTANKPKIRVKAGTQAG